LVHDSRGIKIVNFTILLALSAGTLMASAGTLYRLVPAHFNPCLHTNLYGAKNRGNESVALYYHCCMHATVHY